MCRYPVYTYTECLFTVEGVRMTLDLSSGDLTSGPNPKFGKY